MLLQFQNGLKTWSLLMLISRPDTFVTTNGSDIENDQLVTIIKFWWIIYSYDLIDAYWQTSLKGDLEVLFGMSNNHMYGLNFKLTKEKRKSTCSHESRMCMCLF